LFLSIFITNEYPFTEKYAKAVALLSHDNAEKTADVIGINFDVKKIGFKG
jgi:hypothetical protein